MIPRIARLDDLPEGFAALLAESEASGYRFLRRVLDEWERGVYRFDRPGEALVGAMLGGRCVGVCGLGLDPYQDNPRVARLRNVYVLAEFRNNGIGRGLVNAAIAMAWGRFDRIRLRADEPAPAQLYESAGFLRRTDVPDCTHVLELA